MTPVQRNKIKAHFDRLMRDMRRSMNNAQTMRMFPGKPDPKYVHAASGLEAVRNLRSAFTELEAGHATGSLAMQTQLIRNGVAALAATRRFLDTDPHPEVWLREMDGIDGIFTG